MNWRESYGQLYIKAKTKQYPVAMATGYFRPKFPNVTTANGLTTFVINYIVWSGYDANRISSAGRWMANGNKWEGNGQWIPGNTRKGTADIHAIIKGRHVSIEIKVGKDRLSDYQKAEMERVQRAGGQYWVVKTPEDFMDQFNQFICSI